MTNNHVIAMPEKAAEAAIVRLDKSVSNFVSKISDHLPIVIRMVSWKKSLQHY